MRTVRRLAVTMLVGVVVALGSSGNRAQGAATTFQGIGDLTGGGTGSIVRDATRVAGTIYAVGSSTVNSTAVLPAVPNLDTPALWTGTGAGGGALEALPNGAAFTSTQTASIFSYEITPDATYLASQAHPSDTTGTNWVRATRSLLPAIAANLNLNLGTGAGSFVNLAMSDNGNVNYGIRQVNGGQPTETRIPVRYEIGLGVNLPDLTPTGKTWGFPIPRGTSSNGQVMVGAAANGQVSFFNNGPFVASNAVAFRYVHSAGLLTGTTTLIPALPDGGFWNMPVALSSTGTQTVMIGNSNSFPNGEVYLTDAANTVTATLGSPNYGWTPRPLGGMTSDGAVVAVTFVGGPALGNNQVGGLGVPQIGKYAYLHNSHGWFHLGSALLAQGVDLVAMGWDPTNIAVLGIRTIDGVDLVYGQGRRRTVGAAGYVDGAVEGFVAEFPSGVLAAFNPTPVPPSDQSIVGAWAIGAANNPNGVLALLADGSFVHINAAGFERGVYTWAGTAGGGAFTMTTRFDTNGNSGLSGFNGRSGFVLAINGDTHTITDTNCGTCAVATGTRITGGAGSIVGGWALQGDLQAGEFATGAFLSSNAGFKYFFAQSFEGDFGSETGTYTWDSTTHLLTVIPTGDVPNSQTATLTRDDLGLVVDEGGGGVTSNFARIIAPSSVVPGITNVTLTASGAEDSAFSYTVTAVNALTFSATGLPAGVTIDPNTGVISGTPAVNGTFNVGITVTNTFGDTASATLVLTFAPPPASFHALGDLPGGGVGSVARDATRVNGTIYAVGSSAVNATAALPAVPNLDTPALWTATNSGSSLQALPNGAAFTSTQTASIFSYQITPDATYLASQAHFSDATGTNWVRVTRSLLPAIAANLNLNLGTGAGSFVNLAMSDNGNVNYGIRQVNGGQPTETRIPVRYEIGLGVNLPDLTPTGKSWGFPIPRGTSSNGQVMVGAAANNQVAYTTVNGAVVANAVAFRYVHNPGTLTGTTTLIPTLPNGGSWNMPVALSSTGDQTVVIGNSPEYPNGEVYLTNAANTITARLGSPNAGWTPRPLGGMTSDGAVIAVTFVGGTGPGNNQVGGLGVVPSGRYAYLHNSHGWYHLSSALLAQGVDLVAMGWDPTNVAVLGIRTVEGVDLVYGQGRRRTIGGAGYVDGAVEGFVVELPAGLLASFNPSQAPPTDLAIVGAWAIGVDPNNPTGVMTFRADGSYIGINAGGFERGLYTWTGTTGGGAFTLTTLQDTNGNLGLSNFNGRSGLVLDVSAGTITDTNCATCTATVVTRIQGAPNSIVGGWALQGDLQAGEFAAGAFLSSSAGFKYFFAQSFEGDFGSETGTYTWDSTTHLLTVAPAGDLPNSQTATLTRDSLGLVVDDGNILNFTRVVDPAVVVPTFDAMPTLTATVGLPFAFTIGTTWASTVSGDNLPPGLAINSSTGEITGTPTTAGSYGVLITAENSLNLSANAPLTINVNAPAIVVVPPGNDVTVAPDVPPGTPDVTLTFDNVTGAGQTTVAVIDPQTTPELAPDPPGNFEIVLSDGGVPLYYDISTTATITGPTEICFSYAGVDFGGQTPRLFHYVNGGWIDITSSVNASTQTLCGTTTSFSPFAIFKSTAAYAAATGFYAPVSPIAGYVNTAKAGSTIPLKFNVTLNGQEKTTTTGLIFSVAAASASVCSTSPQDQVDYVTIGDTNLRYDTLEKKFIQNWKLPKTAGCVIARITYKDADQEVLLLTAKFSLK